jgi:putative membrane protein
MATADGRKDRGTALAEERTDLALLRTVIAADRTLMAWIRTALSMIGSGFTIYKFFQYLPEDIKAGPVRRPQTPRHLGLTLIAVGTLGLAGAIWQHRALLEDIGATSKRWSIAPIVAVIVLIIGCLTFYGVLLRVGPF